MSQGATRGCSGSRPWILAQALTGAAYARKIAAVRVWQRSAICQLTSPASAHSYSDCPSLTPILTPTGRESMRQQANKRAAFDLESDARRRHAAAKFESPLPHLHPY
jgi:hypothetical protein